MDPNRIQAVFLLAVEATDVAARAEILERECGADAELRERVEALLAAHDASGGFLDRPPVPSLSTVDEPRRIEGPGGRIGPYKLLQQIGEGGMGVVYLAEQLEPVQRKVALKVIKPGMDTHQVVARFEAERQALALMDHPNIAKVLDAGATDSGRPYFVMELVKGLPITKYCDQEHLTPQERLHLFVPICQAVQHAHQKGIIHRDLKPSNILIALYDGRPVPKVIDFGVAKATGTKLTDRTLFTEVGHAIGTWEYMAPEQAEVNNLDIDTRADVYALGATLYELLAGSPPFTRQQLRKAAFAEMLHLIREVEPPRPSTRLSSSDELPSLAAKRKLEPAKLSRLVRGDLDWIVMKSLEKDRARRYETANGLAADVLRYLAGEPVQAAPPSTGYRLRKFVRKHKGSLAAASLLILALFGAVMGIVYGVIEAGNQREANSLREAAESARDGEERERKGAESARDAEARERKAAEAARDGEARERKAAETARNLLALEREKLARFEYGRTIQLAHQAWRENNVPGAVVLLDMTREDLRGWEWNHIHRLCNTHLTELKVGQPSSGDSDNDGSFGPKAVFSEDGTRIVVASDETAQVWDTVSWARLVVLKGHTARVVSAAFSPDGKRVLTASEDDTARVWDAASGKTIAIFKGRSAVFSLDGKRVLTVAWDKTARVWDAASGAELTVLKGHTETVYSAAFSPDGKRVVTASYDRTARLWDVTTGKTLATLKGHAGAVYSAVFSPDGKRVLTASADSTARVWDATSGTALVKLQGHTGDVMSAVFSPDGKRVLTMSRGLPDKTARVWDAVSGARLAVLIGHTRPLLTAVFSPDGKRVLTTADDSTARLWDATSGAAIGILMGHMGPVSSAVFSPDGSRVVTTSIDGTARVWDSAIRDEPLILKVSTGFDSWTPTAMFSPDGKRVLTSGSSDALARVWDAASGAELVTLRGHKVLSAVFSLDGKRVLTASWDKTARVWDATSGKTLAILRGRKGRLELAAFSPDGTRFAAAFAPEEDKVSHARVWEAVSGAKLAILKGHTGRIDSLVFSPNGKRILATTYNSSSGESTARVWDAASGATIATLKTPWRPVRSAVFSPDGTRVLTASEDGTARVWDATSGVPLAILKGHRQPVHRAVFSPDGKRIATASGDLTARVWDAATGNTIAILTGHSQAVLSAGFNPDGTRIVTASVDLTARVWDAASGAELATLRGHTARLTSAAFSGDGARIVTWAFDGTVRVWNGTPAPTTVARDKGQNLSPAIGKIGWKDGKGEVKGKLAASDPDDVARLQSFCKIYTIKLEAGPTYQFDCISEWDNMLRLEDAKGKQLAEDDDGGEGTNARIVFECKTSAEYRVIVISFEAALTGPFTLTVRERANPPNVEKK